MGAKKHEKQSYRWASALGRSAEMPGAGKRTTHLKPGYSDEFFMQKARPRVAPYEACKASPPN